MALPWNEIRAKAVHFSHDWKDAQSERGEAQTFWNEFFEVFGINRRRVASFEQRIKAAGADAGFIDLLWKGTLLIEHKSRGGNLDKAYTQARDYFPGLEDNELPKFILVCDFEKFRLYDLDTGSHIDFLLKDLHKNIQHFDFIAGYRRRVFRDEDPANIKAAELMGGLHDKLYEIGFRGHNLELFLVRILFCLFADDTGIFEKNLFNDYIFQKTRVDGTDLGPQLNHLFQILNTPTNSRLSNLDEQLQLFPYVNGLLFDEVIPVTSFDSSMREQLLRCCNFNWSNISPAIFGSLFQSVMNSELRRNLGAHYTAEKNILKVIKALFLDDLYYQFNSIKRDRRRLGEFHRKIAQLKFLDPACGCGNFLVIAYRELRLLEIEILKAQFPSEQEITDLRLYALLDVDSMFGIEIEEFPAMIAQVAMWLVDHQMNIIISEEFGKPLVRLPLTRAARIENKNALAIDWNEVISKDEVYCVLGNPPFVGKQHRSAVQNSDMDRIFVNVNGYGVLDYVTCWYIKASQYIQGTNIQVGFVSTNSITQGEQVGVLWNILFNDYNISINFAHRTFRWSSEAAGAAHVHVVIIGFGHQNLPNKKLFEYERVDLEPHETIVANINPYLIAGRNILLKNRRTPLCNISEIKFGNMPNDDSNLLLTNEEKEYLISIEPNAEQFIRPLISAKEFLNGIKKWCIWLKDVSPNEWRNIRPIRERVERVKEYRNQSSRAATRELAATPHCFGEIRQPNTDYVVIPLHSSENRNYIPIDFLSPLNIVHNSCSCIANASLYEFGVIMSQMHMAWVKHVCGRIKSDYRYSNNLVYNNFPWPQDPTQAKVDNVTEAAQNVLDARLMHPDSTLADLYDPVAMPTNLVQAHRNLDRAIDRCYRNQAFTNDRNRMEFMIELYDRYTNPLRVQEE